MAKQAFTEALKQVKIPVLVLDQKWHRLFALEGKPDTVKELESKLSEVLARQGKLTQEQKDLKKLKSSLMQNIVENMEGTEISSDIDKSKKLVQDKKLIDDVNEKIRLNEDQLLDIPREIVTYNDALMMETMDYCYERLRTNYREAEEISEWIKQVRVDLKKNIIRKQNREINNREIYSYMHDIFGKDIINLFDVKNNDVDLATGEDRPEGDTSDSEVLSEK
ncbi:MAG: hypothetical protein SO172_07275 [Pararoseburia sp.]|nr:hypothetical protein [Pararoseburia sp.]